MSSESRAMSTTKKQLKDRIQNADTLLASLHSSGDIRLQLPKPSRGDGPFRDHQMWLEFIDENLRVVRYDILEFGDVEERERRGDGEMLQKLPLNEQLIYCTSIPKFIELALEAEDDLPDRVRELCTQIDIALAANTKAKRKSNSKSRAT